jgi:formate-dependent nitrite reductase membrane component NrfD
LFISLFMFFSSISVIAQLIQPLAWLAGASLYASLLFAPLVVIYAGMMLRSMKAVTLWRTFYLPAGFTLHSIATALSLSWSFVVLTGSDVPQWLPGATLAGLVAAALVTFLHLLSRPNTSGIQASMERLYKGKLEARFKIGAVVTGMVVPAAGFIFVIVSGLTPVAQAVLILACLARLVGDFAYRSAVVGSGAYEPIVPPMSRAL